jgi:multidrug efflux pump subunit AcrB
MSFLADVSKFLFVPLAEAVVFAMLASYILSRTLVPTLAMYLLKAKQQSNGRPGLFTRFQRGFEKGSERLRLS